MPQVPPATLDNVKSSQRNELRKLIYEKEILGYSFSYSKLLKLVGDLEELQACIIAYTEDEAKEEKERLNTRIEAILKENKITSMREPDPFGRSKDILYYPSTSSSFAQARAIQNASRYGIDAKKLAKLFADPKVTVKKNITVIVVKDAKEKEINEDAETANA